MAPPAASSEGIAAQSDLGDTDDTSSLAASIDMDRFRLRGQPLSLHSRSTLEPRSEALSKGGLAGVIVGIIIFFVLAIICAYPFIIRRIKGKRNGTNRLDTAETAFIPTPLRPSGNVPTTGPAASSRMSSRDSLGNKNEALHGPDRQSTKELNVSSHGTDPSKRDLGSYQRGCTGDDSSHAPSVTTRRGTDHTFGRASTWKSESSYPWTPVGIELVATRADGMEYSDATQGHSATYYSPTIPSEAFGMVTPPPTDEPIPAPPPRRSSSYASSLAKNLLQMFPNRRSSTKDSQSRGAKMQPTPELLREGLSDSPTQLTGPFSREIGPGATATRGQLGSPFNPPSPNSEPDQAQEPGTTKEGKQESPPILPPVSPAPGTVNPMDIMAPSNLTEQTWHTNQQLYSIAHPPPKPVEPVLVPEPSQAPTPQSPEQPFEHHRQYLQQQQQDQQQQQPQQIQQQQQQRWDQTGAANGGLVANGNGYVQNGNRHVQSNGFKAPAGGRLTEHDVRMNDVPQQVDPTHLMPDRTNHYFEGEITDPSEHSPPMGGHVSSGASYQTTPNTQIDSSPSPPSDNSSDIRNSASPYPGLQQQSPRTFMCDECGRFFDQVHKLNHHKRYHERPHECTEPNCGKRFGTKTHLDRHINDKHRKTKKFHCTVSTCPYSKTGGKSFPRKDNWRRHMVNIHQVTPMGDPEPDLVDEIMGGT